MSFAKWLFGMVVLWEAVFFLLKYLDFRAHGRIRDFLERRSITVSPTSIGWDTSRYNDTIEYYGRKYRSALNIWFFIGKLAGAGLGIIGLVMLGRNLLALLATPHSRDAQLITPLVPGVTIPINVTQYVIIAFVLNLLLHEFGHAISGASYGLRLDHVGAFSLFFLPGGAYVELPQLMSLNPRDRLRVIYAGVWHNIVIFMFAYLAMQSIPTVVSPMYSTGEGAVVYQVAESHPLAHSLKPNMIITAVNDCPVTGASDWRTCGAQLLTPKPNTTTGSVAQQGYCALEEVRASNRDDGCCLEGYRGGQQCFRVDRGEDDMHYASDQHICVAASSVAALDTARCDTTSDCTGVDPERCYHPYFPSEDELLLTIDVKTAIAGPVRRLYFVGNLRYVWSAVAVSPYTPKSHTRFVLWFHWPFILRRLFYYLAAVSSALALLNAVPAYKLDGEAATDAWLAVWFEGTRAESVNRIRTIVLASGTSLLALNVLLSCYYALG